MLKGLLVLIFANVSAAQLTNDAHLASYYVALANAGSLFGRWVSGIISDRIGRHSSISFALSLVSIFFCFCFETGPLNVMIPFTLFAAAFTYGWPFANSTGALIVVTIIYGFCSGMYVSLMTNPIMNLGGEGDIGRRIGMFMTILAIGALCGPPISGAIETATGDFKLVGVFAGKLFRDLLIFFGSDIELL